MATPFESPMMKHVEGDGVLFVQFKWEGVKNERASEENGRPIFDNVLRVYITAPGNKNQVATHEVERCFWAPEGEEPEIRENLDVKRRFAAQLQAWESNCAEELAGTPLKELTGLSAADVETCRAANIHTIEALANVADGQLFMGARKWRSMAQDYMEKADDAAPATKLAAKNEALEAEVEALKNQIAKLNAPKKTGGPKKAAA